MTAPARQPTPDRPRARDPYGLALAGPFVVPIAALAGLLVIAFVTLNLFNGQLPLGGGSGSGGQNGPTVTPAPSNEVIPDQGTKFRGSIAYAKQGSIWIQTQDSIRRLTTGNDDQQPSWSPDGQYVYFIRTIMDKGLYPAPLGGKPSYYTLDYPLLMRARADGSGQLQQLASGKFSRSGGQYQWFFWMRQPVVSPNGSTIALVSDQPNPQASDVVVQFFNPATRKFSNPAIAENAPLGHQDPAWAPGGRAIAYTKNGANGARGAPAIWIYTLATRKARAVTGPGYIQPSFSPDGRYIAATRTSALGTDVVILDATTGAEVARVTTDGTSWAPAWSPAGDGIAFLHVTGQIVDLRLAPITPTSGGFTVAPIEDLTTVSGLDGASRPEWYIPASQLPAPSGGGAGSPSSSP